MSESPFTQNVANRLMYMSPEHQHRQACRLTQEGRPRSANGLLPDGYVWKDPILADAPIDRSIIGIGTYTQPGLLGMISAGQLYD
jgi:hypothetical protein